jgi:hypothetical protein
MATLKMTRLNDILSHRSNSLQLLELQEDGTWDRKCELGRPVMFVAGQHFAGALENFPL